VKTKNFHWHVSGLHFRDYHPSWTNRPIKSLRLSTQSPSAHASSAEQRYARSATLQRVLDNDTDFVTPVDMLAELRDDNQQLAANLRDTHGGGPPAAVRLHSSR